MPTTVDRDLIVDLLSREFGAISDLIGLLSAADWSRPTCLPGWTVQDVVSHMVGTELMLSGAPTPAIEITRRDHVRNPVAEANELWVESMRTCSGPEMVRRWSEVTSDRLTTLEAMGQSDFDAPSWTPVGNDETYGRFMRIRHFDCFMHEHDIRFALGLPARSDPGQVAACLDEVATGLGYIVGRKAAMPDGSRVVIEITGDPARTYRIQVDGRAAVVDDFDGPVTVGIELPAGLFLRLTGGRDDSGMTGAEGVVVLSGDAALAQQLSEHLAFTI